MPRSSSSSSSRCTLFIHFKKHTEGEDKQEDEIIHHHPHHLQVGQIAP